jgi:uncharacterized protein
LALGGCRSAPTTIYNLEPTSPGSRMDDYHGPALRVDTLNVPAGWERMEILKVSSGALAISEFDHWAAPLAQMARQTLSVDLDERLPHGSVIYPRLPKPSGALGVNVDILDFSIVESQASIRVSWIIVSPGDAQSARRSATELRSAVSSGEPSSVVHAWSQLIGQLADRIAADAESSNAR